MDKIAFLEVSSDSDSLGTRLERTVLHYKSGDLFQMNDRDFQENFRLNKVAFKYILPELESACLGRDRQGALSAKDKLCACLRLYFLKTEYLNGVILINFMF